MNRSSWRNFVAPLIWAALLFLQSSIPDPEPPLHLTRWDDKWAHILIYLPLGFLLLRVLVRTSPEKSARAAFGFALCLGSLYGISDELHQYFVPGRTPDWRDWVADTLGVALGAWIYWQMKNRKERRVPPRTQSTRTEKILE